MRGRGMVDFRKLAAMDIALLGYRVVLAEYVFAVVFSPALGVFVLLRRHADWQVLLGIYFLCLGVNYLPLLIATISIGNRQNARAEIGNEIEDRPRAMAKYRRVSLALLVPLLPAIVGIANRTARNE